MAERGVNRAALTTSHYEHGGFRLASEDIACSVMLLPQRDLPSGVAVVNCLFTLNIAVVGIPEVSPGNLRRL